MTQKTINILYLVLILLVIGLGVIFFYNDAYRLITGRDPRGNVAADSDKPPIPTISTIDLKKKIESGEKFLLLDVRTAEEFLTGHIDGSVNLPISDFDNLIGKLTLAKNRPIITMCDGKGCNRSDQATTKLIGLGFENVSSYHDGITAWQLSGHPVTTTTSVDINSYIDLFEGFKTNEVSVDEAVKKLAQGAIVIDVQTNANYAQAHIQDALFMDLSTTFKRSKDGSIPKSKVIIFYSEDGNRSKIATTTFLDNGYTTVYSLSGGIAAWKAANKQVVGN